VIERAGYDLLRVGLRVAVQLWPLWLFWFAWNQADAWWLGYLRTFPANRPGGYTTTGYVWAYAAWPTAALLGPALVMAVGILLHRIRAGSRAMALAGIAGMAATALLTGWPEAQRLWPYLGAPGYSPLTVLNGFDGSHGFAVIAGLLAAFIGYCVATRARPIGSRPGPALLRGASDNFGHADWLPMPRALKLFPGPDPAYGGLVVGEAYRVDQDRAARRGAFDPADQRTWGSGGKAPLLIDPCRSASTHALVFAGAGGFKTTSAGIPTLLTWTGAAVVLDPSREMGPMMRGYREGTLGHQVVTLDPANAGAGGFNALDWIDPASPLAESQVDAVVGWISGESRVPGSSGSEFFREGGRGLIACLLADMLWDPDLPAAEKTLRTLRRRIVTPEDEMRELLGTISQQSHSPLARDLAGTLKGAVKETYSGIYQNATKDTRWLSTSAYADLVSGTAFRTRDLASGKLTVFVQVPLNVLKTTPALGRVIIGALLNAVYEADGALKGRVLFLLDEVARLGYMQVIEQARDAGRKYGITLMLLYQSLGQLIEQWGREGKQAWYDSTSWRLFAAVQDPDTARELSAMCGEYGVVSTSTGDTEGNQSRGAMGASSSSGRSENRSEVKRALIKPDELVQDTRADEAFVVIRGSPPLRCGRAIYFRRPEWAGLVGGNRFHRGQDAAE
jgi:type IV secretion system protein VirD4